MQTVFFSIVIPTFNSQKVLDECLRTMLRQSFTGFEILVMDGVSTDDTLAIARRYATNDARVRVFSEKDKGIYDAMNKGVANAKGEFIYFSGSDDRLANDQVLDNVYKLLKDHTTDFFYGNVIMNGKEYDGEFDLDKLIRKNISHQAIFYKADIFQKAGNYDLAYKAHADWEFNLRIFSDGRFSNFHSPLLIALFGEGGVSAAHDIAFLRKALLPFKLSHTAPSGWSDLTFYDDWWRLIRNAGIRGSEEMNSLVEGRIVPSPLVRMVKMQSRIPEEILRTGLFSKGLMCLSFFRELFYRK
jgi:glycosyltransferase involved in cell wall biosynthesis